MSERTHPCLKQVSHRIEESWDMKVGGITGLMDEKSYDYLKKGLWEAAGKPKQEDEKRKPFLLPADPSTWTWGNLERYANKPSGLTWQNAGSTEPTEGEEIKDSKLSQALSSTTEFVAAFPTHGPWPAWPVAAGMRRGLGRGRTGGRRSMAGPPVRGTSLA